MGAWAEIGPGPASRASRPPRKVVLPIGHKGACRDQDRNICKVPARWVHRRKLETREIIPGGTCTKQGCLFFHSTVQFSNTFSQHRNTSKSTFPICPTPSTLTMTPLFTHIPAMIVDSLRKHTDFHGESLSFVVQRISPIALGDGKDQ